MTTQAKVDLKIITLGDVGVGKSYHDLIQSHTLNRCAIIHNFNSFEYKFNTKRCNLLGKTCLVQRYVQDQFVNNTVSVSNFRKSERAQISDDPPHHEF